MRSGVRMDQTLTMPVIMTEGLALYSLSSIIRVRERIVSKYWVPDDDVPLGEVLVTVQTNRRASIVRRECSGSSLCDGYIIITCD